MTKNSISLGRAVAGVCMILVIAAVIGLLGSFAPSSSNKGGTTDVIAPDSPGTDGGGGEISGDTSGVVGNTIKKGTYRWKDTITPPTVGNIVLPIPCYVTPVTITGEYEGESYSLTFGGEYIHIDADADGDILYGYIDGTLTHQQCYSSADGWNYLYNDFFTADGLEFPELIGFGQVFTINEDIDLDDFYAPWFFANAERVE